MTLDSHRPLTYETQMLTQHTNYNIKTPNLDDFMTKDSALPDEQEDRIRTIQASEDEFKHMKSPVQINTNGNPVRTGQASGGGR